MGSAVREESIDIVGHVGAVKCYCNGLVHHLVVKSVAAVDSVGCSDVENS